MTPCSSLETTVLVVPLRFGRDDLGVLAGAEHDLDGEALALPDGGQGVQDGAL